MWTKAVDGVLVAAVVEDQQIEKAHHHQVQLVAPPLNQSKPNYLRLLPLDHQIDEKL